MVRAQSADIQLAFTIVRFAGPRTSTFANTEDASNHESVRVVKKCITVQNQTRSVPLNQRDRPCTNLMTR